MSDSFEPRRPRNLVWLPNKNDELTTLCRGAVLIIEYRANNQYPWKVVVGDRAVREGVALSQDQAQEAAIDAAVAVAAEGVSSP